MLRQLTHSTVTVLDKTDWETASLEEYIPPQFKNDQGNSTAASSTDRSEDPATKVDEAATSAVIPASDEIGVDEPSVSVEPSKSNDPGPINERRDVQLPGIVTHSLRISTSVARQRL